MKVTSRVRSTLSRIPGVLPVARLTAETIRVCLRYRVTGLASEAGFFALLSLPPLVLGLFGGVGYVGKWLGQTTVNDVTQQIVDYSGRFLTSQIIQDLLLPTVDDVLQRGRFEFISVGFVLSIWSGSRALNVFVDTISIMYGQSGYRGIVRTRILSLSLYLVSLVVGVIVIPLVLIGPSIVGQILPDRLEFLVVLYWPVVSIAVVVSLTTLFHIATPRRSPFARDVPGALLTLVLWALASYVVRGTISASLGGSSIYGPLSTPIVLLIWLYFIAIAVLIGAALNAAIRNLWPREDLGETRVQRAMSAVEGAVVSVGGAVASVGGAVASHAARRRREVLTTVEAKRRASTRGSAESGNVAETTSTPAETVEKPTSQPVLAGHDDHGHPLTPFPDGVTEGTEDARFGDAEQDRLMSLRTHSGGKSR